MLSADTHLLVDLENLWHTYTCSNQMQRIMQTCGHWQITHTKKRVPKWLPWGTILESGSLLQKGSCFSLIIIFRKKWCPLRRGSRASVPLFLYRKCIGNSVILESGTKTGRLKDLFYGQSNGAPREPLWCHLFFECSQWYNKVTWNSMVIICMAALHNYR